MQIGAPLILVELPCIAPTGLQGAFASAWEWLGEQAAALRRELSPGVAYAALMYDPIFRFYYIHNGSRVAMRKATRTQRKGEANKSGST